MRIDAAIDQLERQGALVRTFTTGITADQATWQPDPDTWSMFTVMEHFYEEEIYDFRSRLAAGFGLPDPAVPGDPPFGAGDLAAATSAFMNERALSLRWLSGLADPDWSVRCPALQGTISAGDMLVSWAAHDILHIRQFVELLFAYTAHDAAPYSVDYAGEW